MAKINPNYQKLPGSYLFSEIARRTAAYSQAHPEAKLIKMGIGDVTLPLVPFPGYARNEQQWKGDVSYLIYREAPWDVAFTFVPYDQWSGEGSEEET